MKLITLIGAGLVSTALVGQGALVHHYTFDETTGTTAADSAGANDGSWVEGAGAGLAWTAGKIGNAADFQNGGGAVNYFNIGTLSSLAGSSALSVSTWIQVDSITSGYRGLLTSRSDSSAGSWAFAHEGNHIDFHTSGAGNQLDSAADLTIGSWFHVVATWDNATGERNTYLNGVLSTTNTFTGGVNFGGDGNWRIGNDDCCGDRDFDGRIDDLAVFDSALSASDAAAIFAGGNAGLDAPTALAVPEASTSLLGALAALGLLRRRR